MNIECTMISKSAKILKQKKKATKLVCKKSKFLQHTSKNIFLTNELCFCFKVES